MNKRKIYCVKDKESGTLLPLAGIWTSIDDPEIKKFLKSNPDCLVVECEIIENNETK